MGHCNKDVWILNFWIIYFTVTHNNFGFRSSSPSFCTVRLGLNRMQAVVKCSCFSNNNPCKDNTLTSKSCYSNIFTHFSPPGRLILLKMVFQWYICPQ